MKKRISLLLVACSLLLLLTSCASPLVGTWNTTIDGDAGQIILKRNGTGEIISNGVTRPCTWEAEGNTFTVVQEIDGAPFVFLDNVSYVIEENVLTITSYNGSKTLVLTKE